MDKKTKTIVISLILSFFLISTSYAIYRNARSGSGTVALAQWSVTLDQNGIGNNLTVVPGVADATYTLKVKSLSDVDVTYDVIVSNLPAGISISIDDTDNTKFVEENNGIAIIENAGVIRYNAANKTNTHSLIFRGTNNANEFVNNKVVAVNVVAKQVVEN